MCTPLRPTHSWSHQNGNCSESTAQPLTALTTNYSLHPACMHTAQCSRSHDHTVGWAESGVACGVICRGCSPLHSPTAEWRPQGGRGPPHSLCSPRTMPTRVDQYRRTPHSKWYVCMCVLCVWTTGASLAGTTHRVVAVSYSLSECDPRVVYTLWWTVGGALPGRSRLMHSHLLQDHHHTSALLS